VYSWLSRQTGAWRHCCCGRHVERRPLDFEEGLGESRDLLVKSTAQLLRNRTAQRLRGRRDPAVEEARLPPNGVLFDRNEVAHHIAQGSDVVLRFVTRLMARKPKVGQLSAERYERCFARGAQCIRRRV
jgi:hypothetical protein